MAHVCHFGGSVAIVNLLLSRIPTLSVGIFAEMTSIDRQRENEIESLLRTAGARR